MLLISVPLITIFLKSGFTFAKKLFMRCLLIVIVGFLFGCNSSAQTNAEVSAEVFEKGLADKQVQLLDVRTAAEFKNGHIKNALQANWNDRNEFEKRAAALDKNKPVYIYCLSGPRSNAAASWLRKQGFANVVELRGGFSNWKRAGKPVVGMPNIPQMTLADYQKQIAGKEYMLVDFGAEWCPPCRKMEPTINEFITTNNNVTLLKIDGGVHTDLMKQLNVEGIPTVLFLKNGTELWRKNGVVEKEELNSMFQLNQ